MSYNNDDPSTGIEENFCLHEFQNILFLIATEMYETQCSNNNTINTASEPQLSPLIEREHELKPSLKVHGLSISEPIDSHFYLRICEFLQLHQNYHLRQKGVIQ